MTKRVSPARPKKTTDPKQWTGAAIRQAFLDYFEEQSHTIVPSMPLIPGSDPTLLFTNSGMVQFKDVFLGADKRAYTRVADSQKCMRVAGKHNDLEDVGRDDSHHTFFEMLGNWSFGDYYKKEAIAWAWQLLTEVWGLDKSRLWTTCFEDEKGIIPRDDEAAEIWKQQPGFDPTHQLFFGRKENFWEMAEVGPCGPDSEIHYDRGAEYCNKTDVPGHVCGVNGDCKRYLEIWNLVFIQYNRTGPAAADLKPLPKKHVDTGMGLERIVSIMQGVDSNYKTDLFTPILATVRSLTGHTEAQMLENFTPYRVIGDHARAAAFMIGDGILPGNTGRSYVCRMIIRRAARFGWRKLGFDGPFLAKVAQTVIEAYGPAYPELLKRQTTILRTLTDEEQRFQRTLDLGTAHLNARLTELAERNDTTLTGEAAFDLYATYGLPYEITRDIAEERGMKVDEAGFWAAKATHADASRSEVAVLGEGVEFFQKLLHDLQTEGKLSDDGVEFDPYNEVEVHEPVIALIKDGHRVKSAKVGDKVEVVLPTTCFYIESGGQVADTGWITMYVGDSEDSDEVLWEIEVEGVRRAAAGLLVHTGKVAFGNPKEGDHAWASIDTDRRWDIMRNHTATHLLQAELRYHLGEHVHQAGSLVAPERLRFDFTHPTMLTAEQLRLITQSVNDAVLANYTVKIEFLEREAAIKAGAMALFGEKYGATVRTVQIGDPELFSFELCGGTHVPETADIGPVVVVSEEAAAAGVRRIEALTGRAAHNYIQQRIGTLDTIAAYLKTNVGEVDRRVLSLLDEHQAAQKEISRLRRELAQRDFDTLLTHLERVKDIPVLTGILKHTDSDTLREMTDWFRNKVTSGVVVLGTVVDNRPQLVAAVTEDLIKRGLHAGDLVKAAAKVVGGSGGGRPNLAQAGGKDASRLTEALAQVKLLVEQNLKG